jgi:putative nucleotidyltransferase with HDIG domain
MRRVCRSGEPEHHPATWYRDERISGWRENYVYRLDSGEIVAMYDDVTGRVEQQTRIERLNRALRTLSACNVALVHANSEKALLASVCRQIVETGGHRLAWVEYPPGKGRAPVHFGDEAVFRLHAGLALQPAHADVCLAAVALRERRTRVCNDIHAAPECGFQALSEAGIGAMLAMPLLHDGNVHGVLAVLSDAADAFGPDEIRLAEELAGDLGYGIATLRIRAERDRAVERQERYEQRLHASLTGIIAAMAATLEMRDPYTAGHQRRVSDLAAAIAREMGLEEGRIEGLRLAGLVHDLGKISIPAEILVKPSRLSAIEFQLIQGHADAGYHILKDVDFPWPIADIVRQHHERLDGSGYPQGLKDGQMLLESKIMAVADVVEAISSHRPYRPALGVDAGLGEIIRGRGAVYDADGVDACLRLFREKGFAFG